MERTDNKKIGPLPLSSQAIETLKAWKGKKVTVHEARALGFASEFHFGKQPLLSLPYWIQTLDVSR